MPGSILNADTNFPHFTGNESTDEKINTIQNYLYMLYEQLRYSMGNLGTENFSEGGLKDFIALAAKNIDITGVVTFHDLETAGATVINGANLMTGTVFADVVRANAQIQSPKIYGGTIYSGDPSDSQGYIQMTPQGLDVYNPSGLLKAQLGYTSGQFDYPFLQLGAGSDAPGSKGMIKKFRNGLWIGNNVQENADGRFSPQTGCHGIFCDFEAGEVYVVNDTDAVEIFIGQTVARFG